MSNRDFHGELRTVGQLEIVKNMPIKDQPYIFRILKPLRFRDADKPDGWKQDEWSAFLQHIHDDPSHGYIKGVVFIPQKKPITITRRVQAQLLMQYFPDYFEPINDLAKQIASAIGGDDD